MAKTSKDNIEIAIEPEGASLICRNVMIDAAAERHLATAWPTKLRYIVADCGGGTVDIVVHELDRKTMEIAEIHQPTGGP